MRQILCCFFAGYLLFHDCTCLCVFRAVACVAQIPPTSALPRHTVIQILSDTHLLQGGAHKRQSCYGGIHLHTSVRVQDGRAFLLMCCLT